MANLELQINPIAINFFGLWKDTQSVWSEPVTVWGESENFTQKGSGQMVESNPGPAVLTTTASCWPVKLASDKADSTVTFYENVKAFQTVLFAIGCQ